MLLCFYASMLVGHQKQQRFLKKSAEKGKTSHAYLFSGQEKLGKKTIALDWISWILGEPVTKLLTGIKPDFILVEPIEKEIKISQIRELNWKLSLRSYSVSSFKTVIIDKAHSMNQEAQNCFLKTLEEPRGKTILILITEHPEVLLPTILSRTEIIKFYPVSKKEIEDYLTKKGVPQKKIKIISQISQGKPGMAIDFLNQPQKLKELEVFFDETAKLTEADLASRFQYVQNIFKSSRLKEILNTWLFYFREALLFKMGAENSFKFFSKLILSRSSEENRKLLKSDIKRLKEIQKTDFLISTTNVNSRLALENLMLKF